MSDLDPAPVPRRYTVLVPVKPPSFAKSRLAPLGDPARRSLVVAFAVDTITAALETPEVGGVLAVTDDHEMAAGLSDAGAVVIPDDVTDDLNASLVQAAMEARRRWPDAGVAALCADLPALRSAELSRALGSAAVDRMSFVADRAGTGTTTVLAPSAELFVPQFGPQSRKAHAEAGAFEIDRGDVPTLRHDVDTPEDLAVALDLGVGSRTAVTAAGLRL
jgi:2-phospho-L-lactate guanylyltransferase